YTERRTRAAFAEFPDGTFAADMLVDGDGVTDEPVKLAATVTIESGRVSVDLTGCDDQRKSPTNATSSQTYSGVVYVLKCLIDPDIPVNDGFYRLIDIKSRPGSVVHAQHPAAVAAGWEIAMQLCDLLFRALAPALPDRVVAGTKGCVCNIAFGGVNPASGEYFTYYETIAGGYGATLTTDGMDAVQAHFQNTENAPVEETEANYPVRILRYELIENSEGGGRHRGGLGVRRDYTFPGHAPSFSILSDKARFAPWGLFGGEAARPAKYILNPETQQSRELPSKITFQLAPGDVVSLETPGRRRAGRRRDRRHPRRQGAHDPGGSGAGLHGRARARPRRVPGHWPQRGRRGPRHDGRDERDHRGQDGARRHAGDARLPRHPRDRPPDPLAPLRRAPAEAGAPGAATLQSRGNRAPRPRGARAPASGPRRGAPGCAATAARRRGGRRRVPPAFVSESRSRARCRRDRPHRVAGCFPVG